MSRAKRRFPRGLALRMLRNRLDHQSSLMSPETLAESALIVAPHPDDETLGCGGTILQKRRAGAEVKALILSDGRHSHPGLEPDALGALRCSEARDACRTLELPDDAVEFAGIPDQSLALELESATQAIEETLRRDRPEQIFVPYRFDLPEDHFATYQAGTRAIERAGLDIVRYEYPVWFWDHWPWSPLQTRHPIRLMKAAALATTSSFRLCRDLRVKLDISDVIETKQEALQRYGSQMQRPEDDPSWPILADVSEGEFLSRFLSPFEFFHSTSFTHGRPSV